MLLSLFIFFLLFSSSLLLRGSSLKDGVTKKAGNSVVLGEPLTPEKRSQNVLPPV